MECVTRKRESGAAPKGDPALAGAGGAVAQYQLLACECDQALHGEPYRCSM